MCHNDCQLYTGELSGAQFCRQCNESRLRDGKPKVFRYLPLIPQLQALFATAESARWMRWAGEHQQPTDGSVSDVSESAAFQRLVKDVGAFDDCRTVQLLLAADGVCPFKRGTKSCCPILVKILNKSSAIRDHSTQQILLGIARCAPKSMNPYLQLVLDEVLVLSGKGVKTYDAFTQKVFTLRGKLLLLLADYPGMSKILSMMGSGTPHGCLKCEYVGSVRLACRRCPLGFSSCVCVARFLSEKALVPRLSTATFVDGYLWTTRTVRTPPLDHRSFVHRRASALLTPFARRVLRLLPLASCSAPSPSPYMTPRVRLASAARPRCCATSCSTRFFKGCLT